MAPLYPDHRAQRLMAASEAEPCVEPEDPLERSFFHYVKTGGAAMPEVTMAVELWRDDEYRHVFNALALSEAHHETVTAGVGLAGTVYQAYQYFFFDVAVFPHNLARDRYVRRLTCSDDLRKLYEVALERGSDELVSRYRVGVRPRLDPEDLLHGALADMWSKFLTHRGYAVTTDVAKEALRWGEAMARIAKGLADGSRDARRAENAIDDLRIALEIRSETKVVSDLGIQLGDLVTE